MARVAVYSQLASSRPHDMQALPTYQTVKSRGRRNRPQVSKKAKTENVGQSPTRCGGGYCQAKVRICRIMIVQKVRGATRDRAVVSESKEVKMEDIAARCKFHDASTREAQQNPELIKNQSQRSHGGRFPSAKTRLWTKFAQRSARGRHGWDS